MWRVPRLISATQRRSARISTIPILLIQRAMGFDQNYAINGEPGTLRLAARLEDPKSGRDWKNGRPRPEFRSIAPTTRHPAWP